MTNYVETTSRAQAGEIRYLTTGDTLYVMPGVNLANTDDTPAVRAWWGTKLDIAGSIYSASTAVAFVNADSSGVVDVLRGGALSGNEGVYSAATGAVVSNAGYISGSAYGVDLVIGSVLSNSGELVGSGAKGTAVRFRNGFNTQASVVDNSGTIRSVDDAIQNTGFTTLQVKNTGNIVAANANKSAISSTDALDVFNAGNITGRITTIASTGYAPSMGVRNAAGGVMTSDVSASGYLELINDGVLTGAVSAKAAGDVVKNSGLIRGGLSLGAGANTVETSGAIEGGVFTGDGADLVTIATSGRITGDLSLGDGRNGMTNAGYIGGSVKGGDGVDVVTTSGLIAGDLTLGAEANVVRNIGVVLGRVGATTGRDQIINQGKILGGLELGAGGAEITNAGELGPVKVSGASAISNIGAILAGGEMRALEISDASSGDTQIFNAGVIQANGAEAVFVSGGGSVTFENTGTVQGKGAALNVAGVVRNSGKIVGAAVVSGELQNLAGGAISGDVRVSSSSGAFTNAGVINGTISSSASSAFLVVNAPKGEINGSLTAGNTLTLQNAGSFTGFVKAGSSADSVVNTGTILGDLSLGDGVNLIDNSGVIQGAIGAGADYDRVINRGLVTGGLNLGAGGAEVTNSGKLANLTVGAGGVHITNTGEIATRSAGLRAVYLQASLNGGRDVVFNSGSITSVSGDALFLEGGNGVVVENSGTIRAGDAAGARAVSVTNSGASLTNSGEIFGAVLLGGDVHNEKGGLITGDLAFRDTQNRLWNDGALGADVLGGSSYDTYTNTGLISGRVDLGGGLNQLSNSGEIAGAVRGGDSNDVVVNTGRLGAGVDLGQGANTLINSGAIAGAVAFGGTGDGFTNSGTVTGDVILGGGDDVYDGSHGRVTGLIVGGQGSDVITGGDWRDVIYGDGVGGDVTGAGDILAGGMGDDLISGGYGGDTLYGNQGDDVLYGNQDNDWIHGGQGNDLLYGGQGADILNGGAGDDVLFGNLADDLFVIGPNGGRDVIADLGLVSGNNDRIQFTPGTLSTYAEVQSHMTQSGANVIISIDAANSVTVVNMVVASLTPEHFLFGWS